MELHKCGSDDELAEKTKKSFIHEIKTAIDKKGKAIVAIPGGRTVVCISLFKILKEEDLDWSKVHLFMIDERMVPIDDKDSNYLLAKGLFLDRFSKINVHPFKIKEGVEAYNKELANLTDNKMVFDVVLLSSGEDGHVAALYPNHESIKHKGKEYFTMTNSPKPPSNRMTASPEMIKGSSCVVILFDLDSKQEAYDNFNNETLSEQDCPAKLALQANHKHVVAFKKI